MIFFCQIGLFQGKQRSFVFRKTPSFLKYFLNRIIGQCLSPPNRCHMNACQRLRLSLKEKDYLVTPGITNAMQAMVVEKVGFDFIYVGGFGTSVDQLGLPDVGFITETEMLNNARNIANAVRTPIIADADTGYGNAINVIRTVRDFEKAGVAGIHIEDQVSPKRCGHFAGKEIIPLEEAVGKIRAALDAREDKDFLIIARTDAVAAVGGGIEEAIKRGKAFAKARADMVFCEFPSPAIEAPRKFATEIRKDFPEIPFFFNYSSSFKWNEAPLAFGELGKLGFKMMIISLAGLRVSLAAVWDYAVDLKNRKEEAEIDFQKRMIGHPTEDYAKFAGFPAIRKLERQYLSQEEVEKKYEKTQGYK